MSQSCKQQGEKSLANSFAKQHQLVKSIRAQGVVCRENIEIQPTCHSLSHLLTLSTHSLTHSLTPFEDVHTEREIKREIKSERERESDCEGTAVQEFGGLVSQCAELNSLLFRALILISILMDKSPPVV